MGVVPAINLSNLVALDAGGLIQALQLIMQTVQEQQQTVDGMQVQLATQKEQFDTMQERANSMEAELVAGKAAQQVVGPSVAAEAGEERELPGSRRVSVGDIAVAEAPGHKALEVAVEALSKRLARAEQKQSEFAEQRAQARAELEKAQQDGCSELEKRLDEERQHRQSLEHSVRIVGEALRIGEAKSLDSARELQEVRTSLTEEFQRTRQQFEARVRQAEDKASKCREDAKAFRSGEDTREYAISEVKSEVRKVSRTSKQALESSDGAVEAQRDISDLSHIFEVQFSDLEARLQAKASESIVEAMKSDFEMTSKVMQDAVRAVGQKLSEQEQRLRGLEIAPRRNPVMESMTFTDTPHCGDLSNTPACPSEKPPNTTHCLLCHNDRSMSPTRTMMGIDNQVYGHIETSSPEQSTQLGEPQLISALRASPNTIQNAVRPKPTPASIPRPQSAPIARLHPEVGMPLSWEVKNSLGTTAVAVNAMRPQIQSRPGRDVKSSRLSDLVAVESRTLVSSKTLSRPQSAQQRPTSAQQRPSSASAVRAPVVRPSSAGAQNPSIIGDSASAREAAVAALEEKLQPLLVSHSMPTLNIANSGQGT